MENTNPQPYTLNPKPYPLTLNHFDTIAYGNPFPDQLCKDLNCTDKALSDFLDSDICQNQLKLGEKLANFQAKVRAQRHAADAIETLHQVTGSTRNPMAQRLAATELLACAGIHPQSPPTTILHQTIATKPAVSNGEANQPPQSAHGAAPQTPAPSPKIENPKWKIQNRITKFLAPILLIALTQLVPAPHSAYTPLPATREFPTVIKNHSMDELRGVIERVWGYKELRALQEPAMAAFIAGRDSLTVLPTGGGKSLCYQAPALYLSQNAGGPTVVVSPLIALMKDQVDSLRELGVPASQMDSSLSPEDRRIAAEDMRSGRLAMLFVSPERLVGNEGFQQMLRDAGVRNFAIDEAHCISHWGHDFRPEYRKLAGLKDMFPGARVHGFTATATERVRQDIADQLKLDDPELLVGNFDRANLAYRVLPRQSMLDQIREILERHENEAGIIYCPRRRDVDEISKSLAADQKLGRRVAGYHAGMSPELRKRVQNQFIQEECDLIVATVAFGMGIDRSNIRFIIHTACPKSIESYQQETGRAGRDGLEAECVLLYSGADAISNKSLVEKSASDAAADGMRIDPTFLPAVLKHIDEMDRFARGAICRHRMLVEYFGQEYAAPAGDIGCGACDICLGDTAALADSVVVAQKILSCVARTGQRFGAAHVISVLRGEDTERIRSLHHDELSTHGLLSDFKQAELRDFVYQLIGQGALAQENLVLATGHTAGILKLNAASLEVMKGKRPVKLVQIVRKSAREARKTRGEAISWESVDKDLFETLRKWRKREADEREVPPYVVFSDATLRELAKERPETPADFRKVKGIGEMKLAEYGRAVLEIIARHVGAGGGGRGRE